MHNLLNAKDPALVKAFVGDSSHSGTPLGEGRLSLIDNQVSATTGTIKVKARFDNPDYNLWPGQLVNIEIQTGLSQNALVVPPQVVQRGLDNYFVYRTVGDKVETVPVATAVSGHRAEHHQRRQPGRHAGQRWPVATQTGITG